MKLYFIVLTLVLISCIESVQNNDVFHPNHPMGEFKMNVKRLIPCDPGKKNKIQINYYLYKTSTTTAVSKGNVTVNGTQIDDNLNIKVNFDMQDSTGGWTDNTFVFKKKKACSVLMSFVRKQFINDLRMSNGCPITEGVYPNTGVPATNLENVLTNVPKVFFYGTYKIRLLFTTKENEELGCITAVIEIKRPWET